MVFKRFAEQTGLNAIDLPSALPVDAIDAGGMEIDPEAVWSPSDVERYSPLFLYRLLQPAWSEANQSVQIDYDLAAAFADELGQRAEYVGDTGWFAQHLVDRTSDEPDRVRRLKKIIHDAILGPPNGDRHGLLDEVVKLTRKRDVHLYPTFEIVDKLYSHAYGWGPLEPYMRDEGVTEIMVVAHDRVFTERTVGGVAQLVRETAAFESRDVLTRFVSKMAQDAYKGLSHIEPTVDMSLPSGERVNTTIYPVTDSPTITIRRFREASFTLNELASKDAFSEEMLRLMREVNLAGGNIVTYGETGSGKTTLLTALINDKDPRKRLIIVEDTREIGIDERHQNSVRMLTGDNRNMQHLVKNALRMRPDHLIVGETRDATAFDLIQAFNTGTRGSMSTLHANNPRSALRRMTTLVRMAPSAPGEQPARAMVADAIHLLVHQGRLADRTRAVLSIDEVGQIDEHGEFVTSNIFKLVPRFRDDGSLTKEWVHNPQYVMGEALASLFAQIGLDPTIWTGWKAREAAAIAAVEEPVVDADIFQLTADEDD